jgi:hypothetical protein
MDSARGSSSMRGRRGLWASSQSARPRTEEDADAEEDERLARPVVRRLCKVVPDAPIGERSRLFKSGVEEAADAEA